MPYSTYDDVLKAYPKVETSGMSPDMIRSRIEDADAEIDAMLAHRYTVPFAADPVNTPPLIRTLSKVLAVCDVFDRAASTPEWLKTKCTWAREMLAKLAEGEISLPGVEDSDAGQVVVSTDYTPVFGRAPSTLNERVDPQLRRDEAGARGQVGIFDDDDFFD